MMDANRIWCRRVPDLIAIVAVVLIGGILFAGAYLGRPTYRRWRGRRRR